MRPANGSCLGCTDKYPETEAAKEARSLLGESSQAATVPND